MEEQIQEDNIPSSNLVIIKGNKQLFRIIKTIAVVFILEFFIVYLGRSQSFLAIFYWILFFPLEFLLVIFSIIGFFRSIFFYFKTGNKSFALFLVAFGVILIGLFYLYGLTLNAG